MLSSCFLSITTRVDMAKNTLVPEESRIFARKMREARKLAGYSQKELGARTNLTQTFISAVERNKKSIRIDNAARVAEALSQPLWKLLNPSD